MRYTSSSEDEHFYKVIRKYRRGCRSYAPDKNLTPLACYGRSNNTSRFSNERLNIKKNVCGADSQVGVERGGGKQFF